MHCFDFMYCFDIICSLPFDLIKFFVRETDKCTLIYKTVCIHKRCAFWCHEWKIFIDILSDIDFIYNKRRGLAPAYNLGPSEIKVGPTNFGAN